MNPIKDSCLECGTEVWSGHFICWNCYEQLKGAKKVTTFEQAVNQWKEKYPQDNRMFSMKYMENDNEWKAYRGTYIGEKAVLASAKRESEARKARLIGISYKGEMYALFSEGTCIWEKDNA